MLRQSVLVVALLLASVFAQVPQQSVTLVPWSAKTLFNPPEDFIALYQVSVSSEGESLGVEKSGGGWVVYRKKSPQVFELVLRLLSEPQIQIIQTVGTAEVKASYRKYTFYLNGSEIIGVGYTTKVETFVP